MKSGYREKIILYGTGGGYKNALENGIFEQYDVVAVADSASKV